MGRREEMGSNGGRDGRCLGSVSKMPDMTLAGVQVEQNCPSFSPHRHLFTLRPVSFFDLSHHLNSSSLHSGGVKRMGWVKGGACTCKHTHALTRPPRGGEALWVISNYAWWLIWVPVGNHIHLYSIIRRVHQINRGECVTRQQDWTHTSKCVFFCVCVHSPHVWRCHHQLTWEQLLCSKKIQGNGPEKIFPPILMKQPVIRDIVLSVLFIYFYESSLQHPTMDRIPCHRCFVWW